MLGLVERSVLSTVALGQNIAHSVECAASNHLEVDQTLSIWHSDFFMVSNINK